MALTRKVPRFHPKWDKNGGFCFSLAVAHRSHILYVHCRFVFLFAFMYSNYFNCFNLAFFMFFYGQKPPNHSSMCVVWNGIKCTAAFGISLYSQAPLGHMLEPWASTLMESTKDQRNARSSEFILSFSSAKPGLSCQHLFPLFLLALSELVQSFMECWVKKWWREVYEKLPSSKWWGPCISWVALHFGSLQKISKNQWKVLICVAATLDLCESVAPLVQLLVQLSFPPQPDATAGSLPNASQSQPLSSWQRNQASTWPCDIKMDFRELADLRHFQCIPKQRHEKLCKKQMKQQAISFKSQTAQKVLQWPSAWFSVRPPWNFCARKQPAETSWFCD